MANDKVQFSVSATPVESVGTAQEGGADTFIVASETGGPVGGSGEVLTLASGWVTGGGDNDGYADGSKHYVSSAAATSPTAFTALAACEFMVIKHSGFRFSSSSALGVANTADYLTIRALKGSDGTAVTDAAGIDAGEEPILAVLKAGEAFVLPLRGGLAGSGDIPDASFYGHHSTTSANNVAGANTIAVEFFFVA